MDVTDAWLQWEQETTDFNLGYQTDFRAYTFSLGEPMRTGMNSGFHLADKYFLAFNGLFSGMIHFHHFY